MKQEVKAITFNKANECEKQKGISPESIIYCGEISEVAEGALVKSGLNYEKFFNLLKDAKEGEDYVIIYTN